MLEALCCLPMCIRESGQLVDPKMSWLCSTIVTLHMQANSGRKDGCHYAAGCLHHVIPDDCWIVDPSVMHNANIIVKVASLGKQFGFSDSGLSYWELYWTVWYVVLPLSHNSGATLIY